MRFSAHRGVTLIELMISMLILALVCTSWLEIIGIQSAKKEARRREAVERLAGMMDAFLYDQLLKTKQDRRARVVANPGGYYMTTNLHGCVSFEPTSRVMPVFEDGVSPVGYLLRVVEESDPLVKGMTRWEGKKWLVGLLYNRADMVPESGEEFFRLPICLW